MPDGDGQGGGGGLRFEHGLYAIVLASPISVAATNAAFVATAVLFARDWRLGRRRPLATPLDGAIFAWALATFVSCVFSLDPVESFRDLRSQGHWLLFYLVAWGVAAGAPLRGLENAWLGAGVVAALHGVLQVVADFDLLDRSGREASGFFSGDFPFAVYMAMLLPLALVRWSAARTAAERLLPGVAIPALAAGLALTERRGAWIALLVATAVSFRWLRARAIAAALLALLVVQAAVSWRYPDSLGDYYRSFVASTPAAAEELDRSRVHSNLWRIWMWRGGLDLFEARPVAGVGPETIGELSRRFRTPYRGFSVSQLHSNYFEVLATRGFAGLAALFLVWISAARWLVGSMPGAVDDPRRPAIFAALGALVVVAVEGLFSFNLGSAPNQMGFYVALGLGSGAALRGAALRPFARPLREAEVLAAGVALGAAFAIHRSGAVPPALAAGAGAGTLVLLAAFAGRAPLPPFAAALALAFGFVAVAAALLFTPLPGGHDAALRVVAAAAIPFTVASAALALHGAIPGRRAARPNAGQLTTDVATG